MEDKFIGSVFENLTVIARDDDYVSPTGGRHQRYVCRCKCGNTVSVLKEYLTSGRQKSCGCLRKYLCGRPKHREIHSRLYRIWGNMVNRCTNPNNPAWHNYGGRGIKVCDEWLDYIGFSNWAKANGYSETLSIDRIDNDGGYNPDNCRWADIMAQANNKRSNHQITYKGETKTISEWARTLSIPYKTLHKRIVQDKWSVERAFTQPVRKSAECRTTINDGQKQNLR